MHASTSAMAESRESFWNSLRALNITRIIIAGVLFAYWGLQRNEEAQLDIQAVCCTISAVYLGLALLFAAVGFWHRRHFLSQLLTQILVDIVVISVMYVSTGGMKSGLAILYLFPLASAAILMSLVMSLFFASLVTFVLLSECAYQLMYQGMDARPMQTGIYGAAFFASVFVVNRLAGRLISQETLAIQRGNDLQVQVAISRLAIDHIDDGVMVINSKGLILACNPAAERMLGLSLPYDKFDYRLADVPFLKPLADAFAEWKEQDNSGEDRGKAPVYLMIKRGDDEQLPDMDFPDMDFPGSLQQILTAHLEVRFAAVRAEVLQEDRSVIFLQDVAKIENQAQQLKLASMGRLTASIAHEVRNPLTAISHATSLLREDIDNPAHVRLLNIISENVARMNRMVGDILYLSRKAQSQEVVHLADILAEIKTSFREMHRLPEALLWLDVLEGFFVRFDSMHLREVVINLLGNAIRYASGKPGSIRVSVVNPSPGRIELHVQDDGPGMTPEVRAHLFEPFFTTSSKGTGLGLYLARELCLNNGAHLDYEYHRSSRDMRDPASGRFVITFPAAAVPAVPVINERVSL